MHCIIKQIDASRKRKTKETRSGLESTSTWMMLKAMIDESLDFDVSIGTGDNKDSKHQGGRGCDIKSKRLNAAIHRMDRYLNRISKRGVWVQRRKEGSCPLRFHHVREGRWGVRSRPQRRSRCRTCLGRLRFLERGCLTLLLGLARQRSWVGIASECGCVRVMTSWAEGCVREWWAMRNVRCSSSRRGWR